MGGGSVSSEGTEDLGERALPLTGFGSDVFEEKVATTGINTCLSVMQKGHKGHKLELAHRWPAASG